MQNMTPEEVVNGVGEISKNINDYGPATVILAVFLFLFMVVIISFLIINQKQVSSIISQYKALSKTITDQQNKIIGNLLENEKEEQHAAPKDMLKNYVDIHNVLRDASKKTLVNLKADRVAVYVFHNGNKSAHGFPFYKMSCVGEYVIQGIGIFPKLKSHIDIPLYSFGGIIESLYNNGVFENISDQNKELDSVSEFTDNTNAKYIYLLGIRDDNLNLAGFSVAEFKKYPEALNIEHLMKILNDSIRCVILNTNFQEKK